MKVVLGIGFIISMMFFMPVLGVLFGGFAGWVVGLFFGDTILTFLHAIGVETATLSMWQIGASLGFIGSFFRTAVTSK